MARSATPLGPTCRGRSLLDGPPTGGHSSAEDDLPAAFPGRPDRACRVLPGTEGTSQTPIDTLEGDFVADLRQLWIALPEHDKTEFEGHFSRMVLRLFLGLTTHGGRP